MKTNSTIHFLRCNDQIISDPKIIAEEFAETFMKNSSTANYQTDFITYKEKAESESNMTPIDDINYDNDMNSPISMHELQEVLKKVNNSAPGPDNIPNCLIKNLPTSGINILLKIYNHIWLNNVFPQLWKTATVIPIPKPGKDQSNSYNYRPISLTCNLCKILEKIINKRIRWFLESQHLIKDNQFGFRTGHSTTSHLISTTTIIQEAFLHGQHVILVNLDIEKAYDMVWTHRVAAKLLSIGIKGNMFQFLTNFISNRSIQVRISNNLSTIKKLNNGLPQGSVLSVTLFLIAVNDADDDIVSPVVVRKYADDMILLCKGRNFDSTNELMQTAVNSIYKWSMKTGFKFSADKSECMVFSKKLSPFCPKLFLGNKAIKTVTHTKILGLIFDHRLTWQEHISKTYAECKNRLNVLKCLNHNNWGSDKNTLLLTYKALVRSKIDYGSIVYNSACNSTLKKLDTLHNCGLRISTGCFHTSPTGSILIEAAETNLAFRRQTLSIKYAIKAKTSLNKIIRNDVSPAIRSGNPQCSTPFYNKVAALFSSLNISRLPIESQRIPAVNPWIINTIEVDKSLVEVQHNNLDSDEWKLKYRETYDKYKNNYNIFIDGRSNSTFSEAIVKDPKSLAKFRFMNIASQENMFNHAILEALKKIIQNRSDATIITNKIPKDNFKIYDETQSKTTARIKELLHMIKLQGLSVIFLLLPNQLYSIITTEIHNNETNTKIVIDLQGNNVGPNPGYSKQDVIRFIRRKMIQQWEPIWRCYKTSNTHKSIDLFISLNSDPKMTRREQVLITRIRTGHSKITHRYLLENTSPPLCDICQVRLSVEHIITSCRKYENIRTMYFNPNEIDKILYSVPFQNQIVKFCKTTNVMLEI